jgi:hypothetical protein
LLIAAAAGSGELGQIVRAVEGLKLALQALEECEAASFLRIEDGQFVFSHPLVRAAVYHAATPAERRAAHAALAAALAQAREADLRAWHLASAALGPSDDAASALASVGERALERSAYATAATCFGRSAQLTRRDEGQAERFLAAADAAWLAGNGSRARAWLEEARGRTREPNLRAEIDHLQARISLRQDAVDVSITILLSAAKDISRIDPGKAARLLAEAAADALLYAGATEQMFQTADWAWELACVSASREAKFFAGMAFGQALVLRGRGAEGLVRVRVLARRRTLW